jgi:sec-independent protein translocase protein TatC
MLALGMPMVLLYEVALIIGWLNDRRKARQGNTSPYADLGDDETSPLDMDDRGHRRDHDESRGGTDEPGGRVAAPGGRPTSSDVPEADVAVPSPAREATAAATAAAATTTSSATDFHGEVT